MRANKSETRNQIEEKENEKELKQEIFSKTTSIENNTICAKAQRRLLFKKKMRKVAKLGSKSAAMIPKIFL